MSSSADNTLGKLRDVMAQRREAEERILLSLCRALDLITQHNFLEMEDSCFSVPFSCNCCLELFARWFWRSTCSLEHVVSLKQVCAAVQGLDLPEHLLLYLLGLFSASTEMLAVLLVPVTEGPVHSQNLFTCWGSECWLDILVSSSA